MQEIEKRIKMLLVHEFYPFLLAAAGLTQVPEARFNCSSHVLL